MTGSFVPGAMFKARMTFTENALQRALDDTFGWISMYKKRRRLTHGVAGTSDDAPSIIERQIMEVDALVSSNTHRDSGQANDGDCVRAREFLQRCLGMGYSTTIPGTDKGGTKKGGGLSKKKQKVDEEVEDGEEKCQSFIGINPVLWEEVCTVIYNCAAESRNPKPARYMELLFSSAEPRTGLQLSHLGRVLSRWGVVDAWKADWNPGPMEMDEDRRDSWVQERLLCTDQQAQDALALYKDVPENVILRLPVGRVSLYRQDLNRLSTEAKSTKAWLSDQVIDSFMSLLQRREDDRSKIAWKTGAPCDRTFFIESTLYRTLSAEFRANNDSLPESVFLKRGALSNVLLDLRCTRMVMACNGSDEGDCHWVVVEIDFRNRYIRHYCPLGKENARMARRVRMIRRWLGLMGKHRYWAMEAAANSLKLQHVRHCAAQENGIDCGVFALAIMDFVALGLPVERITQTHMRGLRKKYLWELFAGAVNVPNVASTPLTDSYKDKLRKLFAAAPSIVVLGLAVSVELDEDAEKEDEAAVGSTPAPNRVTNYVSDDEEEVYWLEEPPR
jgi:hypothetical protein